MERAGVFIGVDSTGGMPTLRDAAAGARRMHAWALAQGMPEENAILLTDADGAKVTGDAIFGAITRILDGAGVDQLLVYFAGHGVSMRRSEYWLLSDAPRDTSAAVAVAGSRLLAEGSGVRHVVFVSDACRTPPEGLPAQAVIGREIFPNDAPAETSSSVDVFYGCGLGRTAAEVKDPAVTSAAYRALYTDALLEALSGRAAEVLSPGDEPADHASYVLPPSLKDYLARAVPARVAELGLVGKVNQLPDAIVTVGGSWVSRVEETAGVGGGGATNGGGAGLRPVGPPAPMPGGGRQQQQQQQQQQQEPPPQALPGDDAPGAAWSPLAVMDTLTQSALTASPGETIALAELVSDAGASDVAGVGRLARDIARELDLPPQMSTGVVVRGDAIDHLHVPGADVQQLDHATAAVVGDPRPGASALVVLGSGRGVVLPIAADMVVTLTVADGELVDVAYEPSQHSWQYEMFRAHAEELRALRAVTSAGSQQGTFRLGVADADAFAERLRLTGCADPGLSIYAAHAFAELGMRDQVDALARPLRDALGFVPYDVALLGSSPPAVVTPRDDVAPAFPMLTQGWAVLRARRAGLPPSLRDLERYLVDSLWTQLDPTGVDIVRSALTHQEL